MTFYRLPRQHHKHLKSTNYEVKDGKLHIPNVPGVGLEWDEKAVAAHLVDNF